MKVGNCAYCGKEFEIKNNKKFCHNNCRSIAWNKRNPLKRKLIKKEWISANKDKSKEASNRWKRNNKERTNKYKRDRYKNDAEYRLAINIRGALKQAIKRQKAIPNTVEFKSRLGCSVKELKLYLESLFKPGMSWYNHGDKGWHIDHVVPISSFDLNKPEEVKKACHYTNLQPLWWYENLTKSNKIQE